MMFFFPFGFLISILLIFFAVRVGMRFFQRFFGDNPEPGAGKLPQGRGSWSWLPAEWRGLGGRSPQALEAKIFRIAYRRKGRITVSDVVIEVGIAIKEAEELLNGMVDGMRVRMEVDPSGMVIYEFPEIIARFEKP